MSELRHLMLYINHLLDSMEIESILTLPIEQKIGQLFFIGISGSEIDDKTEKLLADISPGGVCLFARNIREAEATRRLLDGIRDRLPIEPVLSLDQEGGLVDRLRRVVEPMPAVANLRNALDSRSLGETTAEIVKIFGFNMNFAPVVDVIDEHRAKSSNGLFSRAFGKSVKEVVELGGEYLEALQEAGCLGCVKHFPGLGASEVDSHEELPEVKISKTELEAVDLEPYRALFSAGSVHAVMVGHGAYPNFDLQETDQNGRLLPSSLSFNIVTKLLRHKLGFEGLAITDDLEMGAILKNYGIGEACKRAILAGQDMLAICASEDAIREGFSAVKAALESGEITEQRIDESLTRIAKLKSKLSPPLPFDAERLNELSLELSELKNHLN